jgi:hypothetical protein
MARGKRRSASDDILRSTWEFQRDIEQLFKVTIRVEMLPAYQQRGVYRVRLLAWPLGESLTERPAHTYERQYPDAAIETLPGAIFVAMVRFERQIAGALGLVGTSKFRDHP